MEHKVDRFDQVNRIFLDALRLPAGQRSDFVREVSSGDSRLRDSVFNLLSWHERDASFLDRPAFASVGESAREIRRDSILAGRFRIIEMLGRGGMGEVYRAEDTALHEVIAVKVIRFEQRHDDEMQTRFQHEIRLARRISHPNICRIFDLFKSVENGEEILFFTMECLEGDSLADLLVEKKRLPQDAVLEIAAGVAAGLDAAAEAGIIHRDMKPANIILVPRNGGWRPVITDFGLAQSSGIAGVREEGLAGSLPYMAPEQFGTNTLTTAADVFALGLIVYEMASGVHPYPKNEDVATMAARRTLQNALPLRSVAPDLPRHWEDALNRALALDPRQRTPSAGDVVRQMRGAYPARVWKAPIIRGPSRRAIVVGGAASLCLASFFATRRLRDRSATVAPVIMIAPFTFSTQKDDGVPAATWRENVQSMALQIEKGLLQSAHVTVLDHARIQNAWQSMGHSNPMPGTLAETESREKTTPADAITSHEVREIALRSGAGAVLFGEIHQTRGKWLLELNLEMMSGSPNAARYEQDITIQEPAGLTQENSEHRLFFLAANAVEWVRRSLGESPVDITSRSRGAEDVTTNSWSALKDYMAAETAWRAKPQTGEWPTDLRAATETDLNEALRQDPGFALAAGRLADIQIASGEYDQGLQNYQRAARLFDRREDREALTIRGLFAADTLQFAKAELVFQQYTVAYPQDALGFFYLASAIYSQGRSQEALHLMSHAIALAPASYASFYTNQAWWLLAAGQPAEAAKAVERARKITNSEWADQLQCALAFAGYDAAGLEAALRHMQTNGSSTFRSKMFLLAACWQAERGHAAQAETLLRDGLRFDLENGQPASTRMAKTLCLAKLYVRLRDFSSAIGCCRNMLRQNPELRLRFETGALLARAGDLKAARTCIPEGLPSTPPAQPPKTLPPGARPELMEWPLYWRRILRLWAEIALAEGRARSAFSLLSACPPGEYHDEWPEALVRASLAAGEHGVAQDWLKKLAGNPGVYWLWTEVLGPGFIREASFWAETAGAGAGHWQPVTRFLKQT